MVMKLLDYQIKPIGSILDDIQSHRYDPKQQVRLLLNQVNAMTEGVVDIIDPTSPFSTLLSASAGLAASAMLDNFRHTRRQYPVLAKSLEELYFHMADPDYEALWATPGEAEFIVMVQYESLVNHLVKVPELPYDQLIIPRGTSLTVGGYYFLLENSIAIRQHTNGIIETVYDESELTIDASLYLKNNVLKVYLQIDRNNLRWIQFRLPLRQLRINTTYLPITLSEPFVRRIDFDDKFYDVKVYHETDTETTLLSTTYTDQVYDPNVSTVVIKLLEQELGIFIPPVYIQSGKLYGQIRVDIYETKGELTESLEGYSIGEYEYVTSELLTRPDQREYIQPIANINLYFYSNDQLTGGKNPLTFDQIKSRVIEHTVGPTITPVTPTELKARLERMGYMAILNTDIVTNRIYLATRRLPTPINRPIYTPATLSMERLHLQSKDLVEQGYSKDLKNGRYLLPARTVYRHENGKTLLLPKQELEALLLKHPAVIASYLNSNDIMFNPFHYVLDETEASFNLRSYILDKPSIGLLSFMGQNVSLGTTVNTQFYEIIPDPKGYVLRLITQSGDIYKTYSNEDAQLQIRIRQTDTDQFVYYKGTLKGYTEEGERIYEVLISTDLDIDRHHQLQLTEGFNQSNLAVSQASAPLVSEIHVYYTTHLINAYYQRSLYDDELNHGFESSTPVLITKERLIVTFGHYLKHLWTRARSAPLVYQPKRYTHSKLLRQPKWEYKRDPTTGSIFKFGPECEDVTYEISARKGALIHDANGALTYAYKKGDVIKDQYGLPVLTAVNDTERTLDILTIEGAYYFTNNPESLDYLSDAIDYLKIWLLKDMPSVAEVLLEKTSIYYHPRHSLHSVRVYLETGKTAYIDSAQQFKVILHVPERTYLSDIIRSDLEQLTIELINRWIEDNRTLSISTLTQSLVNHYGDSVANVSVQGLGGSNNYHYASIVDKHDQIAIKKKLTLRNDNTLAIEEGISLEFINISQLNS